MILKHARFASVTSLLSTLLILISATISVEDCRMEFESATRFKCASTFCEDECGWDKKTSGGGYLTWCECGNNGDGVDDNDVCHARVSAFDDPIAGWFYISHTCEDPCGDPEDSCVKKTFSSQATDVKPMCGCT